ncbi:type II toxin-antitoxin system HicA family toxin [Candidatus Woesearchaeota archaeon]|nr:type II toxin-antitoxin system HicA family toxin [Candidatus Woesearchaeota archaeon]
MSKLPIVSGNEVIKVLTKLGYQHARTSGDHAILKKEDHSGKKVVPVPLHKELAKGTLLSILHQSGLTKERFKELLK